LPRIKKLKKVFILDTSVLLYDMKAIHSFPNCEIILPLIILDELDRFKDRTGLIGESARYVNRFLDNLRAEGRLDQGVNVGSSGQSIRILIENQTEELQSTHGLNIDYGDNKIIMTALRIKREQPKIILRVITKDINLRVKCDALGITAEDYYKDHLDIELGKAYTGVKTLMLADTEVDEFYSNKRLEINNEEYELSSNEFIIGRGSGNNSFLGMFRDGTIIPVNDVSMEKTIGVEPKNKEQRFAIKALLDPSIPLVTLTGLAGSGKTFLTLMSGLNGVFTESYKRIVITRVMQPVGRDVGFLPGDINEKMSPWLAPIVDNFRHAFKDLNYFEMMKEKDEIEIAPLSFIRGRTFNNSFVIVDEAQNATIHELKTIITRIGTDSKIVLLGDTDQIDTPYIDRVSNGLSIIVEKFKDIPLTAHVQLRSGQRSDIASLASNML